MLLRVQLRRDSADAWASTNPVLASGECGVEIEVGEPARLKIGDGETTWNELSYLGEPALLTEG